MRAADPNATFDHIFEEDKILPVEKQTVFPICQLSAEERAFMLNLRHSIGSYTIYALHLGMGAPRNFFDQKGNPIVFQRDEKAVPIVGNKRPWKMSCLDYLDSKTMDDLAALVASGVDATVKGAEAKNS
jgi:hypothetical protein